MDELQLEVLKVIREIRENISIVDSEWSRTGGEVTPASFCAATELTDNVRQLRELFDKIII